MNPEIRKGVSHTGLHGEIHRTPAKYINVQGRAICAYIPKISTLLRPQQSFVLVSIEMVVGDQSIN